MFERFTERARTSLIYSQGEARDFKHNYIGTEHLLLGVLRVEDGLAAHVLNSLGVTLDEVRAELVGLVGRGDEVVSGQIPFTPRAKRVLEWTLRECLSLGHNHIGTEHILLGLVREGEGIAAHILIDLGADASAIRNEVIRVTSHPGRDKGITAALAAEPSEVISDAVRALTVGELLDSVTASKAKAIDNNDFDQAAMLRGVERRLIGLLKKIPIVGASDQDQPMGND